MPLPRVRILAAPSVAPASYRAAPAPHHAGRAFRSPWPSAEADLPGLLGERGVLNFVRSRFGAPDVNPTLPGADAVPAVRDATFHPPPDAPPASPRDIVYTWLGHAANHIQLPTGRSNRLVVLTDPVFSHRCSPFAFAGPARITRCPTNVAQIAATPGAWPDVLVLSHNHYDHTDVNTLSELLAHADPSHDRPVPHVFCSLGTKSWFTALGYPTDGVTDLDWWDARVLERDDGTRVRFTAVPAQHFSSRGIHDRNKTLWSGFVMEVLQHEDRPTAKVYFAGDTGYRSIPRGASADTIAKLPTCPAFREVGEVFGPSIDFAMIPIGAYGPRWLFSPIHIGPWEAVAMHKEVRSRKTIGIHWGVWKLTFEPPSEPKVVLAEEAKKAGLASDEFVTAGIGETIVVPTQG